MTLPALHQRCWNHEHREAVCRCPECSRGYCRECVAEHEGRLLCAACLKVVTKGQTARPRKRRSVHTALVLGGILLAWVTLFCAGEAVMTYTGRLEQTAWLRR